MRSTDTTCPYCGVGCGVTVESGDDQLIAVSGDVKHSANSGRLCVKGTALGETLNHQGRLLRPSLDGTDVSWDTALDTLVEKLRDTRERYGPESIAFYLSGQLLTEDYYVANKLMKGFLGSANVDTNSRLCMSSAVASYKRAFGEDIVPVSYEDVEASDLLIMVGSNAAWTHPVMHQRIVAAKQANPDKRIVVIDTRRTATSDIADLCLQLLPGSDGHLFAGLLRHLAEAGCTDSRYIAAHTTGFEQALAAADPYTPERVAAATGLPLKDLKTFYENFAQTPRTVTLYSQGINQSASGTDKGNAIINCHLATGRVGKYGAGPFSITGQPNAMGGREVGGLANQLAAHQDFSADEVDSVQRFWHGTDMATAPGKKAIEMFEAIARGEIKFLWVMATNPAVSLPNSSRIRQALRNCDFVAVSDCTGRTDTADLANLLLPAAGWGEKDGTVTNSERVISRQRKLIAPPGDAKPDWWIITQVAKRLGFSQQFDYKSPADIFREHAALSGFENGGKRAFDISALASLNARQYEDLAPVRWPCAVAARATELLSDGHFFTATGQANFIPVIPELPNTKADFYVNTGRLRDQWHTMTRTGQVPRLSRHRDFFSISVCPSDAARIGLEQGSLAVLENQLGKVCGLVALDEGLPGGQVFTPIHWNNQFSGSGTVCDLIPAITDPVSGQPQSKFAGAVLRPFNTKTWGLLFTSSELALPEINYWSRIAVSNGYLTLLSDKQDPEQLHSTLMPYMQTSGEPNASYSDPVCGDYRELAVDKTHLQYALFLHKDRTALPAQSWFSDLGAQQRVEPEQLLAGFSANQEDVGQLICSCWEIGERQISSAIAAGANSVSALGKKLRCGTQCGSCIPELKQLIGVASNEMAG